MIWEEIENVPWPYMYTLLGFVNEDYDPIRQHVQDVLWSIPSSIPNKPKPRYEDSGFMDCYSHYFDKFEPERDILFLAN